VKTAEGVAALYDDKLWSASWREGDISGWGRKL